MSSDDQDPAGLATEGLNVAMEAVHSASVEVDEVGRHFGEAVERSKMPKAYVEMLADATRSAPVAMLITAFLAGMMVASGRRR